MPKGSGFHRASPFATKSFKRVPGEGPIPSQICLIGEKPGRDEARRGIPFCGISGTYLNQFLTIANVPRDTIFVTNCVFEFTDYTKPTSEELERDLPDLIQEVLACDPLIIGLVGTWAIEWVLREGKVDLGKCHGVPKLVTELFGGEVTYSSLTSSRAGAKGDRGGWLILPMLHPANCVYSPDQMPMILDDCLQLGRLNDGEIDVVVDEWAGKEDYRIVNANDLDELLPW
jgi:DNA polymerase